MKAHYRGNKVVVVNNGSEYPFSLAANADEKKCIQLMTKMTVNGVEFYQPQNGTYKYQDWQSVTLK